MKVGDLVVRTYGVGQRPTAIIVDVPETSHRSNQKEYPIVDLIWVGCNRVVQFDSLCLEVINEGR